MERTSLENTYLIVGIRGGFTPLTANPPDSLELALSGTLGRWGVSAPWAPCDSGADLSTPGNEVLRCWNHVDLANVPTESLQEDIPISGLARTTWDAVELYGDLSLTGIDAIVPVRLAGPSMWRRVTGSVVRDGGRCDKQLATARARPIHETELDPAAIRRFLGELLEIRDSTDASPFPIRRLISSGPFEAFPTYPFEGTVVLNGRSVEDAAWLAEAVAIGFAECGIGDDVQIEIYL